MTARAAVFDGPGQPFRLVDVRVPRPGPGECVVRVTLATICGSDLHTIAGKRHGTTPCVLGHEAVGVVDAVGGGVTALDGDPVRVGDRVVWSVAASCGRCFYCRRGLPQKCDTLTKYGKESPDPARGPGGCFASHVHLWPGTAICRVPAGVPDAVVAPAMCATATVAACLRAAGPLVPGDVVLVFGLGLLGLTACAMAAAAGATVVAVDPDPGRVAAARRFGVTADGATVTGRVSQASGDRGADVSLELSGSNDAATEAIRLTRTGGTVVLAGAVSPTDPLPVDHERLVRECLTVRGVHNYAPHDLSVAVHFLQAHHAEYPFAALVERTFPLAEIDAAVGFARSARPVRVGIVPD